MENTSIPLKILLVEDSQADTDLILRQLRDLPREFVHTRVASESGLRKALSEFEPDVILSDFRMPGFSGQEALKLSLALAPGIPLVFVSGTIGEELAIDALQNGAMDYVLKDNLRRLPNAIERALDIAQSRRAHDRIERALRESEERFRAIVESSGDWIWECDVEARTSYTNSAVSTILGFTPEEVVGLPAMDFMFPADREKAVRRLAVQIEQSQGWQGWRQRWCHRDGNIRVLESRATPLFDDEGKVVGFRGIHHDITESLSQEAQIRRLARIHAVLGSLGSAVLRSGSRENMLQQMCEVAVDKGGFAAACVCQLAPDENTLTLTNSFGSPGLIQFITALGTMSVDDTAEAGNRPALRALQEHREVIIRDYSNDPGTSPGRRADMARIGIGSQITIPIGNPPWGVMGLYANEPLAFDQEELDLLQRLTDEIDYAVEFMAKGERLEFLAYHNPVSGLYNRVSFLARLQELVRTPPVSVAVLDITHFSEINESRGRAFGDRLLQAVGHRLRELADKGTLVAHIEADSFALAYPGSGDSKSERSQLEALIRTFSRQSLTVGEEEIHVDLRGGLALVPEHGETAEAVEQSALTAMFEGARRGVQVHVFNEELRGRAARRLELESDLRRALVNLEFELYYQPKFDTATQRLTGAEALLRWHHPERGMMSPAEFIPVLEESELIVPVGRWVMREALRTALVWREQHSDLRIAVNVSAKELRHSRFIEKCNELLHEYSDNQPVDIEVTESLLMDDIGQSIAIFQSLRELGCRIAIDDFGTGYSSLNYLARLPVDMIKIDQSFIALLTHSPETMGLVTNIINLAHTLSLKTVAEGVEEEEQMKLLRLLRCDQLQGYLLGRPVPEKEFARLYLFSASL